MPLQESSPTPKTRQLLLVFLIVLAAVSILVGALNGYHRSQDFQWSGERVLVHHVDPWAQYLKGDPNHDFILTQIPNYLPELYVLLFPVGFLSLTAAKILWILCNLIFATVSALLAAKFYGMRGAEKIMVVCLLFMATATRNSIGNGQQGILVLLMWCLGFLALTMTDKRACFVGISYFKFTFAPPAGLFVLLRWGLRPALMSLVPVIAGLVIVWLWLTGGHDPAMLLKLATEPMAAARMGYLPRGGDSNLMDVLEPFLIHRFSLPSVDTIEIVIAVLVCAVISYFAYVKHRESSVRWQMAVMATMSYALFKHHAYDGIVLLFPLCYGLRWRHTTNGKIVVGLVAYLFYLLRGVEAAMHTPHWLYIFNFVVLMVILVKVYLMREDEGPEVPVAA